MTKEELDKLFKDVERYKKWYEQATPGDWRATWTPEAYGFLWEVVGPVKFIVHEPVATAPDVFHVRELYREGDAMLMMASKHIVETLVKIADELKRRMKDDREGERDGE